jgi:glutathione S-transferase
MKMFFMLKRCEEQNLVFNTRLHIINSDEKTYFLCEDSYCLVDCYIASFHRWAMMFRRKLKSHKATFMERQRYTSSTDRWRHYVSPERC